MTVSCWRSSRSWTHEWALQALQACWCSAIYLSARRLTLTLYVLFCERWIGYSNFRALFLSTGLRNHHTMYKVLVIRCSVFFLLCRPKLQLCTKRCVHGVGNTKVHCCVHLQWSSMQCVVPSLCSPFRCSMLRCLTLGKTTFQVPFAVWSAMSSSSTLLFTHCKLTARRARQARTHTHTAQQLALLN